MNISNIQLGHLPVASPLEQATPLSERFQAAWADAYVQAGQRRAAIEAASNDPNVASNPESLFRLQTQLHDYVLDMTVTSSLVSHMVKGTETLLKS
ncbi:type III secretion system inner rod subunit SctI [Pseudoxanthomonas sp. UTMC 1351]|uniref:type III secretion system inner rod subunit SctI n=1 Tax=Pseudoxanthomonas sp. UTMC 1351 TaxID=2695853 RepID=UPI0034CE7681